jgi:hypothetical protein
MGKVGRYWGQISALALKASRGELRRRFAIFVVVVVAAIVLSYLGPKIGISPLLGPGLALLGAALVFCWKMIEIPADLHKFQLSRKQIEDRAKALDALWERGVELYESGVALRLTTSWDLELKKWEEDVLSQLEHFDKAEHFMFNSIDYKQKMEARLELDDLKAHDTKMLGLIKRVNKLRLIIGRAYTRARAEARPGT